jgi:hypothetical protein
VIDAILPARRRRPSSDTRRSGFSNGCGSHAALPVVYGCEGLCSDRPQPNPRGLRAARPSAGPCERIDSGEGVGVISGVRMKLHVFCFDLPHSDACFVKAYPAETTEAFLDGHVPAFAS